MQLWPRRTVIATLLALLTATIAAAAAVSTPAASQTPRNNGEMDLAELELSLVPPDPAIADVYRWQPPSRRTTSSCAAIGSDLDERLTAQRAIARDVVVVRMRLRAKTDVALSLVTGRVRRVDIVDPFTPMELPGPSRYAARQRIFDTVPALTRWCTGRDAVVSSETLTQSEHPVVVMHLGRSVATLDGALDEMFRPLEYTNGSEASGITLFRGETVTTAFQLTEFGGLADPRAPVRIDRLHVELVLEEVDLATGARTIRTWTSQPFHMVRGSFRTET